MGQAKRQMTENEEQYESARSLLCEFDTLEECENHSGTYFDGDGELERVYKIVNARL